MAVHPNIFENTFKKRVEDTDHVRKSVWAFLYDITVLEGKDAVLPASPHLPC